MGRAKYTNQIVINVSDEQKAYIDKLKKEGHTSSSDVIRIMIDRYRESRKYMRGEK